VYNEGQPITNPTTFGQLGNTYPAYVDNTTVDFLGLSQTDLIRLATISYGAIPNAQFGGENSELDDAGTYFDLGPRQVTKNGIYHYVCTRNNNFSNRDQKATMVVSDAAVVYAPLGAAGGTASTSSGQTLYASPGSLSSLVSVGLVTYPSNEPSTISGSVASEYVLITPQTLPLNSGSSLTLSMVYTNDKFGTATMYRADSMTGSWSKVSSGGTTQISQGGVYVVQTKTNWGAIVGITLSVLVVIAVAVFFLYRRYRKPSAKNTGLTTTTTTTNSTAVLSKA